MQLVDEVEEPEVASPVKLTPIARGVVVVVQGVKLIEFAVFFCHNKERERLKRLLNQEGEL